MVRACRVASKDLVARQGASENGHQPMKTELPNHTARGQKRNVIQSSCATAPGFLFLVLVGAVCLAGVRGSAQNYSIDWFTIDGGGGTSTGGVYSVSGTIGQPDAGAMSGGNYTLNGGFWAIYAVQTPGAPTLAIVPTGLGQATISWSPNSGGWVLQETPSLSPTNWINSVSGPTNPITIPVAPPTKFYRLFKP
jgi:hypothetical protein